MLKYRSICHVGSLHNHTGTGQNEAMLYRLRTSLAYRYFQFTTRALDDTAPLTSDPHAPCEVHTMLRTHDATMYILAIKSLLSYVPELSVVVHSDGSLTHAEVDRVKAHVSGVRFVLHGDADERAAETLRDSPFLLKWRSFDAAYRRLIDVELWRRTEKIIILDSDVLTYRKPQEVVDWIRSGDRPFLLGQPPTHQLAPEANGSEHVQALFRRRVGEVSERLGTEPLFIQGATAGFCGYSRELSLERVEAALKAAIEVGLPMSQWGGDQCLIIYLLSVHGGTLLSSDRYLNFEPSLRNLAEGASMIHFYGTHRFHGLVYPRLAAATIQRLRLSS